MKRNHKIFSLSLYREGLLHIKLIGVAAAVVCIALCALVVGIRFTGTSMQIEEDALGVSIFRTYIETVIPQNVAIPAICLLFFAPFFTMSQFRYLNDRAKSDFYHSIPYTRTCTFFSFFAAIVTWIVGIALASYGVSMLLWTLHPNYVFLLGPTLLHMLQLILGCILLAAMMAVAMSVTGTAASNIAVCGLMCCVVRVVCLLFLSTMEELVPIANFGDTDSFFSPAFFLPIGLLLEVWTSESMITAPIIWYNLAITVALIAVATLLYRLRRSETAGSSAPSRAWQHVYRCAFCTPFAITVAALCYQSTVDAVAVMLVVTLIIYFLYELITTKKLKNLLSAAPYLGVLLLVGLLFAGTITAAREITLSDTPSAEQIQSVSLPRLENNGRGSSFESLVIDGASTDDPKALALVADNLKSAVDAIRNDNFSDYRYKRSKSDDMGYSTFDVVICKKDGSRITRTLTMSVFDYQTIVNCICDSPSFREAVLSMPSADEISKISAVQTFNTQETRTKIWTQFLAEYNDLSEKEKLQLKGYVSTGTDAAEQYLVVGGLHNGIQFSSSYPLNEHFPKTKKLINETPAQGGESTLETMKRLMQDFVNTDFENMGYDPIYFSSSLSFRNRLSDGRIFLACTWDNSFSNPTPDRTEDAEEMIRCVNLILEHWDEITDTEQAPEKVVAVYFGVTKENTTDYSSESSIAFLCFSDELLSEIAEKPAQN